MIQNFCNENIVSDNIVFYNMDNLKQTGCIFIAILYQEIYRLDLTNLIINHRFGINVRKSRIVFSFYQNRQIFNIWGPEKHFMVFFVRFFGEKILLETELLLGWKIKFSDFIYSCYLRENIMSQFKLRLPLSRIYLVNLKRKFFDLIAVWVELITIQLISIKLFNLR